MDGGECLIARGLRCEAEGAVKSEAMKMLLACLLSFCRLRFFSRNGSLWRENIDVAFSLAGSGCIVRVSFGGYKYLTTFTAKFPLLSDARCIQFSKKNTQQ